jgi:hypothetical protein
VVGRDGVARLCSFFLGRKEAIYLKGSFDLKKYEECRNSKGIRLEYHATLNRIEIWYVFDCGKNFFHEV